MVASVLLLISNSCKGMYILFVISKSSTHTTLLHYIPMDTYYRYAFSSNFIHSLSLHIFLPCLLRHTSYSAPATTIDAYHQRHLILRPHQQSYPWFPLHLFSVSVCKECSSCMDLGWKRKRLLIQFTLAFSCLLPLWVLEFYVEDVVVMRKEFLLDTTSSAT